MDKSSSPHTDAPGAKPYEAAAEEALKIDPVKLERDTRLVLARFWTKLRDSMARVPFVEDAVAAFFAATDPKTPFRAKAVLMGALAYFIAPIDALPDFVALLGFTDDATVLFLAIRTVQSHLTTEHYERARAWLKSHRTGPVSQDEVVGGTVLDHDAGPQAGPSSGRGEPGTA